MQRIEWSDGIGKRERKRGLLVIPAGEQPYWFAGSTDQNIRVIAKRFIKNGKWSHNHYEIEVSDGVRTVPITQGWESGKWREGFAKTLELDPLATWSDIAAMLQVPENTLVGPKPGEGPEMFILIPNGPLPQKSEAD